MTNLSRTSTARLVDMLGELKAQKADLAKPRGGPQGHAHEAWRLGRR
jgi:hypothetical protein